MSNKQLNEHKQRFIEDVSRLMIPWGVPQTAARLYGYLLLCTEPVSLDRMAADLEVSKSSASVAARLLVKYTLARQLRERGTKRVLYEASQNYDGMLIEQSRMLDGLAEVLKSGASAVASGKTRKRLEEMSDFYITIRQAMDAARRRWSTSAPRGRYVSSKGRNAT